MVANKPLKILYATRKGLNPENWNSLFIEALNRFGEMTLQENTKDWTDAEMTARCREVDVILLDWSSRKLPPELAENPGRLRYICHLQGSIRNWVPRIFIEKGIQVTNWGDLPADGVAEAALTLLLATLKQLPRQIDHIRNGHWIMKGDKLNGSLHGLRVGVYGLGVIGRRFLELIAPFHPQVKAFDPYLENWPAGIIRAENLDQLCENVEGLVVTAGLTDETRCSLTARHFAKLPDGGIVVNVARGGIIDQPALFTELERGRLRAGLDVLDTDGQDFLPEDHPARTWPNLLVTAHALAQSPWNVQVRSANELSRHQKVAVANLERFVANKKLHNLFDLDRYDKST